MSWRRAKTPGWAAVELKQQDTNKHTRNDPFPPISCNTSTRHHSPTLLRNGDLTGTSFSSVITRSASVPNIMANEDTHNRLHVANVPSLMAIRNASNLVHVASYMKNGQSEKITAKHIETNVSQLYKKLNELHPWANENLIEDVMAAVNNDIDRASTLLREMASPGRLEGTWFEDNTEEIQPDRYRPANARLHVGETTAFSKQDQVSENSLVLKNDELLGDHFFPGKMVLDDNVPVGLMIDTLRSVPVEPEWENDDDMYLIHRKDAIRAMRLASRHSKAATEAYLTGDHVAAQEFSQKAREEWSTSKRLNARAAKEILTIRNCKNDDWKLDLHGLHVAEAVQYLLDRLLKIESQVSSHSANPDTTDHKSFFTQASSLQSTEKERQQQSSRPRLLEVITGKGNHSRGEAALPVAIKSVLSDKRYYYYEPRTGVIVVQPKFRHLSN